LVVVAVMLMSMLGSAAVGAAAGDWYHDAALGGPAVDDLFGNAVAVEGDTVVVGIPWAPERGVRRGTVQVFTRDPATGKWDLEQTLADPSAADNDQFGWAVAIAGGTIVVGAPNDDGRADGAGAVHVFRKNAVSGSWEHIQELLPPPGTAAFAGMGDSVAIDEGIIAAGAPLESAQTGAAYVFVPGPTSAFINEIRIDAPGINDKTEFFELAGPPGASLDGLTYLVIGDGIDSGSGVVEAEIDLAGNSLGPDGLFVVAEDSVELGAGDLVRVLNFENGDNVTHLLVRDYTGYFDDDLDFDDDGILDRVLWSGVVDVVGVVLEENPPATTEYHYGPPSVGPDGSAAPGHVFRCGARWEVGSFDLGVTDTPGAPNPCAAPPTTIWELDAKLTEPLPAANARFGASVGVVADQNRIVVGSPYAPGGGTARGAVHVFDGGPGAWSHEFAAFGTSDFDHLGTSVDATGRLLVAGASGANESRSSGGRSWSRGSRGSRWTS
jgi:hypothetical protein